MLLKSSRKNLKGPEVLPNPQSQFHSKDDKRIHHRRPCAELLDDFTQASKDMYDMRKCNDKMLYAAVAAANSASEFSESLREMGTCLLEQSALNDDEQSGNVLRMLSKVQFELQELVDSYRSQIFQTATSSESIVNQLRTVEEMKQQCDRKRNVYQCLLAAQREKENSKSFKGECAAISQQQLQAASDDYQREAISFIFRLKSLKEGQSQSLLKQAVQHHAAQINLFSKGLKTLEAVDAELRLVAEHQQNDYKFSDLEDCYGQSCASSSSTHKNLRYTLPLGSRKHQKDLRDDKKKERHIHIASNKLPCPFSSLKIGQLHELPSPSSARNLQLVRQCPSSGTSRNLNAKNEIRLTRSDAVSYPLPLPPEINDCRLGPLHTLQ
ncbi:hypothetical protein MKW94_027078 [Papaver nudicaule]|uniref:BAR domain-containing protein n=1 Tax=Papaver nudicaule TaxID=74823 RepID=A0AA41S8S0_PAPNU|nr:hypothetical protein [Papaver nudicaule]